MIIGDSSHFFRGVLMSDISTELMNPDKLLILGFIWTSLVPILNVSSDTVMITSLLSYNYFP
jgi:hypothetical protein